MPGLFTRVDKLSAAVKVTTVGIPLLIAVLVSHDADRQNVAGVSSSPIVGGSHAVDRATDSAKSATDSVPEVGLKSHASSTPATPRPLIPGTARQKKEISAHATSLAETQSNGQGSKPVLLNNYFTLGSTTDEVLAVQGMPNRRSELEWTYGLSNVGFKNDTVASWSNSHLNPLRVKMLVSSESEAQEARSRGYFTAGSTKNDVLAVQGTPTRLNQYEWAYGLSTVGFQHETVATWSVSSLNPLRVKMPPTNSYSDNAARSKGYFGPGSTKDEVLAVQGTPTRLYDYEWTYGFSTIDFQGGRVTAWSVSSMNPLSVKMLVSDDTAANAARARGTFTVGSTQDEVLALQGTPTKFSKFEWNYGFSAIRFQGGKVVSWRTSPMSPLIVRSIGAGRTWQGSTAGSNSTIQNQRR
jgi:hypothetical protein